jgi:hypothetical protein
MSKHATGAFEVTLTPQKPDNEAARTAGLGRMAIEKQFHGDLEATSHGEMLAAQGGAEGSAGYVALERVTGTLHGRAGSFLLQHSGTMNRGVPQLSITVVPDSGTDALTNLAGHLTITLTGGKHTYAFDYTLPDRP